MFSVKEKEMPNPKLPENDRDLYGDDTTLADVKKRFHDLLEIANSEEASEEDRKKAKKRLDDLIDLYVEFLD
jgi:hypothetical protein